MKDTTLANVLGTVVILRDTTLSSSPPAIRVVAVPGFSGSAEEGSETIVWDVYVATAEFGEGEDPSVFKVGSMYEPAVDSLVVVGRSPVAFVSYGTKDHRLHARIAVSIDSLHVPSLHVTNAAPATARPR